MDVEGQAHYYTSPKLILTFVLTPMFTWLGLIGNAIYFLTVTNISRKPHYYIYLYHVLVCDLVSMLNFLAWPFAFSLLSGRANEYWFYVLYIIRIQPVLVECCAGTVNWINAIIALDRLYALTRPFNYSRAFTPRAAKLVCGIMVVANALVNVPRYLCYNILSTKNTKARGIGDVAVQSISHDESLTIYLAKLNEDFPLHTYDLFTGIGMYLVPVSLALSFNTYFLLKYNAKNRVRGIPNVCRNTTSILSWMSMANKFYPKCVNHVSNNTVDRTHEILRPSVSRINSHHTKLLGRNNSEFLTAIFTLIPFQQRSSSVLNNRRAASEIPSRQYQLKYHAARLILVQSFLICFFNLPFIVWFLRRGYFWSNSLGPRLFDWQIIVHFIKHLNPLLGVYINIALDKNVQNGIKNFAIRLATKVKKHIIQISTNRNSSC